MELDEYNNGYGAAPFYRSMGVQCAIRRAYHADVIA